MSSPFFQTVNVQRILTRYGMTTYLTLGDIGLILNILIFSQPVRRRNPCSIYILATSLSSLIGLNSATIPVIYSLDHRNPSSDSLLFCQGNYYIRHVFSEMMRTFIVLACIDRYAVCSDRAFVRLFNQYRTTIRIIPCVVLFWLLLGLFPASLQTIQNDSCDVFGYAHNIIFSVYIIFAFGIFPVTGMITFGSLLIINLKKIRTRVAPLGNTSREIFRKRDREMIRMLLIEIIAYIITTVPLTVVLAYKAATQTITKSEEQKQTDIFLTYLTRVFLLYLNNGLPFWIYISTSRSFRLEFKNLILKWYRFIFCKRMRTNKITQK
jgi:hypothetical protein